MDANHLDDLRLDPDFHPLMGLAVPAGFFVSTAEFDPLSLSPLMWLDASDASTLYDATSGGSLVAADGAVARWQDKSGNANHAINGTGFQQPLRKTAIQNGLDAIRFDGSNDYLAYSTSLFSYTGAATVFAVTKNLTNEANDYAAIIAEYNGAGTSIACTPVVFPNAGMEICTDVYGPGGMKYGSTLTESAAHVCVWSWSNWSTHKSNGNTVLGVDGTEVSGTSYGGSPTGFTSTAKSIGRFDGSTTSANCLNGDLLELIVYGSQLLSAQRLAATRYLKTKWGIS